MMKLIAIDLDGTLIKRDRSISEENRQAIQEVQQQGHTVAICSGRSLHDTQDILQQADLNCPVMVGNGAWTYQDGKNINRLIMPKDVTSELLPKLESEGWYYELYTNKGVVVLEKGRDRLYKDIQEARQKGADISEDWASEEIEVQYMQHGISYMDNYQSVDTAQADLYKIFILSFDRDKLDQLQERLSEHRQISLTTSGITKLEIAHERVSKGYAVAKMAEQFHIPMEETVAIGDNLNDLSMFEVAGTSIAMGNAEEAVKAASTHVTKDYLDHGVAYALEHYI